MSVSARPSNIMLIREVTPADANSYFALRVQSELEFPQFVGFNAERELVAGQSGIAALLEGYAAEGTLVWGAFEGSQLVAVLAISRRLSPKYKHKAFLWGMYVIPEYRATGIAHKLIQVPISWATEHPDVVAISLQVTFTNVRGQQFYKRLGFTTFGSEQRSLFVAGQFHGAHFMELEVKRA